MFRRDFQHIQEIEELTLSAWPALQHVFYDGWVARFADGYTRRSNSVVPLGAGSIDVREKIRFCQELYRSRGLPTVFKLTSASQPPGLDAALAGAGFHSASGAIVKTAELTTVPTESDPRIIDAPPDRWVAALAQLGHVAPKHVNTLRAIIDAIALPRHLALLIEGQQIVASGLAVRQGRWLGLFDIATDARFRRRGFGSAVVGSLLKWGRSQGARNAYLQVVADNQPARAMYEKLGFKAAYEYEYWQL